MIKLKAANSIRARAVAPQAPEIVWLKSSFRKMKDGLFYLLSMCLLSGYVRMCEGVCHAGHRITSAISPHCVPWLRHGLVCSCVIQAS